MKKLYKHLLMLATAALCLSPLTKVEAASQNPTIAVVDFRKCVEESKLGRKEQEAFQGMKQQMQTSLEQKEKELNELTMKFNDADYLDSLAPEAEADLKDRYRALTQEMGQVQNRYYQMLNQANYKIIQNITESVNTAAKSVASDQGFDLVINEDSCFFFTSTHDITSLVIAEMDKAFEKMVAEGIDPTGANSNDEERGLI